VEPEAQFAKKLFRALQVSNGEVDEDLLGHEGLLVELR
jgi:hypothetical protein